jgi:diaminopropionate ammonia-lyase
MIINHYHNTPSYENSDKVIRPELYEEAYDDIKRWSDYAPTPLHNLNNLAAELSIGQLFYKDESHRFGLKSFKALGGAYAVVKVLKEHLSVRFPRETITDSDLKSGRYALELEDITVVTATDGNHGRSVAWGAQMCGIKCKIYMHQNVSKARARAVEDLGAVVVWVKGNYDDSLRHVKRHAIENQWYIISDTSYEGYLYIPKFVMAGYSVMTAEINLQHMSNQSPTHIIIQGGVGGLAGAVCAQAAKLWSDRPRFIVVEPDSADCLYQSAKNKKPTIVDVTTETMMAGLSCGEVSILGWNILKDNADDFVTINDDLVAPAMKILANGMGDDPKIEAGESAVGGLALLLAIQHNPRMGRALGIDQNSRILLFGTEGATDPEIYSKIIFG